MSKPCSTRSPTASVSGSKPPTLSGVTRPADIEIRDVADESMFALVPPCADPRFDHRSCDYWEDEVHGSKAARASWWKPAAATPRQTPRLHSDNPFAAPLRTDDDFNPFATPGEFRGARLQPVRAGSGGRFRGSDGRCPEQAASARSRPGGLRVLRQDPDLWRCAGGLRAVRPALGLSACAAHPGVVPAIAQLALTGGHHLYRDRRPWRVAKGSVARSWRRSSKIWPRAASRLSRPIPT